MTRLRLGLAASLLLLAAACATAMQPDMVRPPNTSSGAGAGAATKVLIFKSNNNPLFEQPISGFLSRFTGEVRVYSDVKPAHVGALKRAIADEKPDLILCMGNEAAAFAKQTVQDIPVLFMLVPAQKQLGLETLSNFMGIAMEPLPLMEFTQFRMVNPALKRVLAFFRPEASADLISKATAALGTLDIQLVAVPARSLREIKAAFAKQDDFDAVWMIADALVINDAAFSFLLKASLDRHKALITSFTDKFAERGALMSASLDLTSLGSQAALLARRVLEQKANAHNDVGVQAPIGMKLAVNLNTAKLLGLSVDDDVLPFINRVYAQASPP